MTLKHAEAEKDIDIVVTIAVPNFLDANFYQP